MYSVFNPIIARMARKLIPSKRIVEIGDFPEGAPAYDEEGRLAYFALHAKDHKLVLEAVRSMEAAP